MCADRPADADRDTHRQPHQHDRDHVHELAANGHRRDAGRALKLADDEQVCHTVQRLQKVGEQVGQGEVQHIFKHTAGGEVFLHEGFFLFII